MSIGNRSTYPEMTKVSASTPPVHVCVYGILNQYFQRLEREWLYFRAWGTGPSHIQSQIPGLGPTKPDFQLTSADCPCLVLL